MNALSVAEGLEFAASRKIPMILDGIASEGDIYEGCSPKSPALSRSFSPATYQRELVTNDRICIIIYIGASIYVRRKFELSRG